MLQHRYTSRGGYYWTCPLCGANLDPDEHCTCDEEKSIAPVREYSSVTALISHSKAYKNAQKQDSQKKAGRVVMAARKRHVG